MEIQVKENDQIEFGKVKFGTVFRYLGNYYICCGNICGNNAVGLSDGIPQAFKLTELISIVKAKLVVDNT